MEPPSAFAKLRDMLASLYTDEASARRIADDAGLDVRRIAFGSHALNNWHAILMEAVKAGKLNRLLAVVLAEYGENQALSAAVALYRKNTFISERAENYSIHSLTAYLRQMVDETSTLDWAGVEKLAHAHIEFPLKLAAVYTALDTLRPHEGQDDAQTPPEVDADFTGEGRRQSVLHFVNEQPYAVLLGEPGSGKTTVANFLTLCLAGERLGKEHANLTRLGADWRHGPLLPLRVVARDFAFWLNQTHSAAEHELLWRYLLHIVGGELTQEMAPLERHLLTEGGLLIVDGFDEVPEAPLQRDQVKQAVLAFRRKFPLVRILLTSRIYAYQRQQWRLPDFEEAVLAPFNQAQVRLFIENWYTQLAQHQSTIAAQAVQDRVLQLSHAIETNVYLAELARRPLLLTLMISLYVWRGGNLPEARAQLYEESIQLLLERWEQPKSEPKPHDTLRLSQAMDATGFQVSPAMMRDAMEELAYRAQSEQANPSGAANIEEAHLMAALLKASRDPDLRPLRVIEFIRDRIGLLYTRGEGIYSFPHRTIQEYLAACYLATHQFPTLLMRLVRAAPERWREVLLLAGARAALEQPYALWVLVGKLCPRSWRAASNQTATENDWLFAVLAGQLLVETGSDHVDSLEEEDAEKRAHVVSWLVALADQTQLSAPDRALAGRVLGLLGDPRPGVQVKATDHLPDIEWIRIEAGAFLMGSESLVKQSISEPFSISRYPITVAQYQAFIEAGGYTAQVYWSSTGWAWRQAEQIVAPKRLPPIFQTPNHPQVGISWYEAMAFCRWLSTQVGRQILLPTEWQWERAARHTDGRLYPWGNEFATDCCNTRQINLGSTSAVGIYPKGQAACGAADMAGNVWEWCRTVWRSPSSQPEADMQHKLTDEKRRVLRGGSFANPQKMVRCANRHRNYPDHRASNVGFRVVMR